MWMWSLRRERRNIIELMLAEVKKRNRRLLITIDEVTNCEHIRIFSISFQVFLRQEYPIFLLTTGLLENIYDLEVCGSRYDADDLILNFQSIQTYVRMLKWKHTSGNRTGLNRVQGSPVNDSAEIRKCRLTGFRNAGCPEMLFIRIREWRGSVYGGFYGKSQ